MEHKALGKPFTVSRLPKFGSRPVNPPGSLPNGTVHSRLPPEVRSSSGKFSGVVRPSSSSIKYGSSGTPPNQELPSEKRENRVVHSPGSRANKKPYPSLKTGNRSASTGSPKPAPESLRSTSNTKTGSTSPCGFKLTQNGTADSIGGGPRLQKSRDNTSSSNGVPHSGGMVRSQSFSHFRQRLPGSSAIPRSFSFNKAVELAKPLPNTQLCPVRMLGLKPPQCISSSRLGVGFGKSFTDHLSARAPFSGCSTPPSGSKKPSLSSNVLRKPLSLSHTLSHVITAKPQRPHVGGTNQEITPPGSGPDGEQFGKSSPADVPDGSEEMSVSSASSDRNYTCEDFDHMGGAVSFSSLELSPSSSGGTYIWDEEMMEPLGHNTHSNTHTHIDTHNTHSQHCSCSILSRMDGEKNHVFDLQNDKILTTDHPQNRASYREEPQWRNSRENHLQNHNWLLLLEGFNGSPEVQSGGHMVALEECSVEQMLEECSSVKAQLLQLQLLLQMEEIDVGMNSKEWSGVNSVPSYQKKDILKEVTSVREDLKNKDEITKQQRRQKLQLQKLHPSRPPESSTTSGTFSKFSLHRGPQ
ncbi:serine-rich coiled-coil domain-containing protein 2-like isoform X1 [Astyanax mexicanus]|uniref:serine-rich coiled-coil domain-containing protein 2-like isoform X1 n=1 Tax=Astyanax mexicanus TaxID=7994 RepID=UPI0020CB0C59|nr:serine-rich coiled-coil domain-containing protein 2-like isoform X1 [Astyanax mexicanus]